MYYAVDLGCFRQFDDAVISKKHAALLSWRTSHGLNKNRDLPPFAHLTGVDSLYVESIQIADLALSLYRKKELAQDPAYLVRAISGRWIFAGQAVAARGPIDADGRLRARSRAACRFIQNSGVVFSASDSSHAVSGVTPRLPRTSSLIR